MSKQFLSILALSAVIASLASIYPVWAGFSDDPDTKKRKIHQLWSKLTLTV